MFRLWGKTVKDDRILESKVFELDEPNLTIEEKIEKSLADICYSFDIQRPMWFDENNRDIAIFNKTCFKNHHFIESVDFDYFEIEIIEDK